MANELRIFQDLLGGRIDNNPLATAGTSLSSPALAAMVAVGATQHMMVVLDPDGMHGAPEIVMVTAHTASATTATILRAQEGTTARDHPNGTDWVHAAVASDYSGLIGDQTLTATATTIDFSSIPATYRALRLLFQGRTDRSGQPSDILGLRVNNDSGANYRTPYLNGSGVAASSGVDSASGYMVVGECPGATGTANTPGMFEAVIPNYAGTTFHKTALIINGDTNGSTEQVRTSYGRWANTAAINRLTIVNANGPNFIAGCRATLYGVR